MKLFIIVKSESLINDQINQNKNNVQLKTPHKILIRVTPSQLNVKSGSCFIRNLPAH
jgi:hypothetical protein